VFKEFGGTSFNEIPIIPLTDYSVKAKILDTWVTNFTDTLDDVIANGDFTIPNSNGTAPQGWLLESGNASLSFITYLPSTNVIKFEQNSGNTLVASQATTFAVGDTYRVTFNVVNHINGTINIRLVVPYNATWVPGGTSANYNSNNYAYYWQVSASSNGIHTADFTLAPNSGTSWYQAPWNFHNKVIIWVTSAQTSPTYTKLSVDYITVENLNVGNARVRCQVLEINNPPTVPSGFTEMRYAVDRLDNQDRLFEFMFPRIAYRYQYEDGEYSAISPFSQPVFLPGTFDYHPKKAHNLGMINRITSVLA
jgi:hypothetical protein